MQFLLPIDPWNELKRGDAVSEIDICNAQPSWMCLVAWIIAVGNEWLLAETLTTVHGKFPISVHTDPLHLVQNATMCHQLEIFQSHFRPAKRQHSTDIHLWHSLQNSFYGLRT